MLRLRNFLNNSNYILEASAGAKKWEKHFKENFPTVETYTKKDALLFECNSGKAFSTISAGSPITVFVDSEYKSKIKIRTVEGMEAYMSFDNVAKPISSSVSGIRIKLQDLGILVKTFWDPIDLSKELINKISKKTDIDENLKSYIISLIKFWNKNSSKASAKENFLPNLNGLAEVKKDFGEILGAIAIISHQLFRDIGIEFSSDAKIKIPISKSQPFIDYYIVDNKNEYAISAKANGNTNTIKPNDIIELLYKSKELEKWENSPELEFLNIIKENSVIVAPFKLYNFIHNTLSIDAIQDIIVNFKLSKFNDEIKNKKLYQPLIDFLISINYLDDKNLTVASLFYATEKYVINYAKKNLDFKSMVSRAISPSIYYVKFNITSDYPEGKFTVIDGISNTPSKVFLRSKNSRFRATDKIGIQIE